MRLLELWRLDWFSEVAQVRQYLQFRQRRFPKRESELRIPPLLRQLVELHLIYGVSHPARCRMDLYLQQMETSAVLHRKQESRHSLHKL